MGNRGKLRGINALALAFFIGFLGNATAQDKITSLIDELANPEFGGRAIGTPGLLKARERIVAALQAKGLQPAFPEKSFLQKVPYFSGQILGPENSLIDADMADFMPLAFSKTGKLENIPAVFVGYGISVIENGKAVYDDYHGQSVKEKIVIALMGDPRIGSKESKFFGEPQNFYYSSMMYKAQVAAEKGAIGILFVRGPLELGTSEEPAFKMSEHGGGEAAVKILAANVRAQWMAKEFPKLKLSEIQERIGKTQKPVPVQTLAKINFSVDLKRETGSSENIVAMIPGHDPKMAKEFVVIGAHYDHLGVGSENSRETTSTNVLHPGADDNASGVMAAIDLAQKIKDYGKNRRPVLVVFFTGEEIGLVGSRFFVENPPIPKDARIIAMLGFDMVGRLQENKLFVLDSDSGFEFSTILANANKKIQFNIDHESIDYGASDHFAFLEKNTPAVLFTDGGHADMHRASDTADKINYLGIDKLVHFAFNFVQRIDLCELAPKFDSSAKD